MEINFSMRLNEFLDENKISKNKLSKILNLSSSSVISSWALGKNLPNLENAIKLADFFKCSLDYLFGFSDDDKEVEFKQVHSFSEQLKKIMKDKKITQNKMVETSNFCFTNFNSWFYKNGCPDMTKIIELAQYLNVSLDYLAGRE